MSGETIMRLVEDLEVVALPIPPVIQAPRWNRALDFKIEIETCHGYDEASRERPTHKMVGRLQASTMDRDSPTSSSWSECRHFGSRHRQGDAAHI